MNGRRAIAGLSLVCAVAFCAFAAPSASALGTTAFTCTKSAPTKVFSDEHCTNSTSGTKEWGHTEIPVNTKTAATATNEKTNAGTTAAEPAILKSKIGGIAIEIKCPKVHATGNLTNKTTAGGEMYVHGTEILFHLTECTVPQPIGQECKIKEGTITSNKLTSTTEGQGDNVLFKPELGEEFVAIKLEGCKTAELNSTYPIMGSVKDQGSGATAIATHAAITAQGTLKFGGQIAGLNGKLTFRMLEGDPLALTTT